MNNNNDKNRPRRGTPPHIDPGPEKASIGGQYNSGVTSDNEEEKDQINKKGTMYEKQPESDEEKKKRIEDTGGRKKQQ